MKQRNNRSLHLTSTRFDEPLAIEKVNAHRFALAFHGYHDLKKPHTLVGGADRIKAEAICELLNEADFSAELVSEKTGWQVFIRKISSIGRKGRWGCSWN